MSFAQPAFLLLAPLAPLVVWWWATRRRPALGFSDARLFDGLSRGRAWRATWGSALLRGSALLALLLAAAGPRTPDLRTRLAVDGIAIVMVLDVSGSMATADFAYTPGSGATSRLDAAKRAFRLFVAGGVSPTGEKFDGRPQDQVALVTFAAVPETTCPLTLNHAVLLQVADAQVPKIGIDAGTNVGDAIAEGLTRLEASGERRKVMILLSDGEHNVHVDRADPPLMPRQAANLAAALGVPVYAIDCGGEPRPDAPPEEVAQRIDGRRVLAAVAETTGGRLFPANTADELQNVYRQIDTLERMPVESFRYRRHHEYSSWCVTAAVGLLAATYLLDRTRWRRIPA